MFYFYTNELGFEPEFMGELTVLCSAASLLGLWYYNKYLKNVAFKKIFTATVIIGSTLGLSQIALVTRVNQQWGIPDKAFTLGGSLLQQVLG